LKSVGLRVPIWYNRVLLFSASALQAKIVTLVDALQLLMLFAGTLTYLKQYLFFLGSRRGVVG
jgi:hypothetical protein